MQIFKIINKYSRWFLLLSACVVSGCVSLPKEEKGIWPWEYGRGQGEPNTGDYAAFRAGVAKFGEPPKAAKPLKPESVEPTPPDAPPAETIATKTEPPAVIQQRANKANGNKKIGYDFTLSASKSTAGGLLLNMGSSVYDIIAFNYGNAPVSVAINIDKGSTQNASADKMLPFYAVVPAHTDQTLVRISAKIKEQGFEFRYNSGWSIGDSTATHYCPEQYRFPFGEKIRAYASVSNTADSYTQNAVAFSMPKGTPVLAARKGVVIQISSDGKIDILHEDSTIGTYHHLEKIGDYVAVGKTVTTDDVIGVAGTSENNKDAYMQLTVWRPELKISDKLPANSQQTGFEAVSYPLVFKSASSDKGKILTKNQPVSRDKSPPSNKQTKRK